MCRKFWNVHVNENLKMSTSLKGFLKQWKINFREKKYVNFLNMFF